MSRFLEIQIKVWWIVYLIATPVFTLPGPVFSYQRSVYIPPSSTARSYSTYNATSSPPEGDMVGIIGEEPVVAASSVISAGDNLIAEASSPFRRGPKNPPRKLDGRRPSLRHPPPIKAPMPPPPHKPLVIKSSLLDKKPRKPNKQQVPKKSHKNRHPFNSEMEGSSGHRRPSLRELSREEQINSLEARSLEQTKQRDRDRNLSFILDELYPSGSGGGDSSSREIMKSPKPSKSPDIAPSVTFSTKPAPFPKPGRPVQLSYYYDSNDKQDLKSLISSHHLKRRGKECDGLENFVYDLEVIAFLLGIVSAIIGFYSDVIPFFNEGVKISYSNNYGDGVDYPHDYWNNQAAKVDAVVSKRRSISIGTNEDNIREVVSVSGEFISLTALAISFVALFPSLVEKFFYSLDWWFGKRGLWKQYLYTYKCEIHAYDTPGWSSR